MAKQTINIGSSAGDPTAESLRSAGDKINDNFTELYGAAGSWTPALAGGTTAGTWSYSVRVGRYVRTLNLVLAWFHLDLSDVSGAAGAVRLTGLPVAPASNGNQSGNLGSGGVLTLWDGVTLSTGQTQLAFRMRSSSGGDAQLIQSGGGSAATVDATAVASTARLRGMLLYEAAVS